MKQLIDAYTAQLIKRKQVHGGRRLHSCQLGRTFARSGISFLVRILIHLARGRLRTRLATMSDGNQPGFSRNPQWDFPSALARLVPGLISASFVDSVDAFQRRRRMWREGA